MLSRSSILKVRGEASYLLLQIKATKTYIQGLTLHSATAVEHEIVEDLTQIEAQLTDLVEKIRGISE